MISVDLREVQKLLGHSSVKVTEVYSHLAASQWKNTCFCVTDVIHYRKKGQHVCLRLPL